ncbi:MAG: hypothetical protein DRI34_04570 [Deltaproteobacteria bacterium]|nr:MAG: hypothetical protein DRI34_04570 [Deltaproteobacteria bacterium]
MGNDRGFSRRRFMQAGGALLAAGPAAGLARAETGKKSKPAPGKAAIRRHRKLGRTGFRVSDISMGCGEISEPNVVRYAYDHGINLFDTAEGYGEGDSERRIGAAMKHLDRSRIFIVTKLSLEPEEKADQIRARFLKCLERLNTNYVDALYLHAVNRVADVKHPGFHAAVAPLKKEGKVRHAGISSHGPRGQDGDSMADVLLAAVADGRFDIMLLVYNFMNSAEGKKVLQACREKNIGTTGMKVAAGVLNIEPFDPKNPSGRYARYLERMLKRGMSREDAVARIQAYLERQRQAQEKSKPFIARHGIKSEVELKQKCVQWALGDDDLHTICVSMPTFDKIDRFLPLSGTRLAAADQRWLHEYAAAFSSNYCRHGCNQCTGRCPARLPVNTILRYAVYFYCQGRQKTAMQKYTRLDVDPLASCTGCSAPCERDCPYGVPVRAALLQAHDWLSLS